MDNPRSFAFDVCARRRPYSTLAALAAFVLTMFVFEGLIGWWCGPPRSTTLEDKWNEFERHADDCDVVFIGTSHVERHIDPRVIDQTLAEHGIRVRSHNLGLPKMSMLEGAELIHRLACRRPRRLKLVVLEPTLYLYDADNWASDRAMAEHDWSGACLAARLTWASEVRRQTSFWGKLKCVAPHGLSFLCRALRLRSGDGFFIPSADTPHLSRPASDAAGFVPLPIGDSTARDRGWRVRFQRFLEIEPDWTGPPLSGPELAYFNDLICRVRQMGATPVFLLGPKVKRDSHTAAVYTSHRDRALKVPLINHLRGHGDEEIYQLAYWHDFDHLNADGAVLLSRLLAAELAPLLQAPDAFLTKIGLCFAGVPRDNPEKLKRK